MNKADIDIEIDQGAEFTPVFTWLRADEDNVNLDLYIGRFEIRSARKGGILIHRCTSEDNTLFTNSAGEIIPIIEDHETLQFDFDWAYYDLWIRQQDDDGRGKIVAGGSVKLNRSSIELP